MRHFHLLPNHVIFILLLVFYLFLPHQGLLRFLHIVILEGRRPLVNEIICAHMKEPSPHSSSSSSSKAVDKSPNDYDNVLTKSFFFLCCLCWNNYGAILTVMCFLNSPSRVPRHNSICSQETSKEYLHTFSE